MIRLFRKHTERPNTLVDSVRTRDGATYGALSPKGLRPTANCKNEQTKAAKRVHPLEIKKHNPMTSRIQRSAFPLRRCWYSDSRSLSLQATITGFRSLPDDNFDSVLCAGLRVGDVLVSVNGATVRGNFELVSGQLT